MNTYYNNNNNNYDYNNFHQENPAVIYQPAPQQKTKKKTGSSKVVALALCFSLLGGALGTGGTYLALNSSSKQSTSVTAQSEQKTEKETAVLNNAKSNETDSKSETITQATNKGSKMTASELYKANVNSTVGITTSINTNYFGYKTTAAASGSGFIISKDGYIVTNHHVIEDATKITVTLYNGKKYEAELVGSDESNDIAVLKIDADDLAPVTLGSSSSLEVGDDVAAIGNPLGELTFSLTKGVVSALDRTVTIENKVMTLIQTDTAINSGNSGGALFNMNGEVIGITNARCSSSGSGYSVDNLCFAIPIDSVKAIINSLVDNGYAAVPYIGVGTQNVSSDSTNAEVTDGAVVKKVYEDSPAEAAGFKEGDIITEVNGKKIKTSGELTSTIKASSKGDKLECKVYRDGSYIDITVTVGEKKSESSNDDDEQDNKQQYSYRQRSGGSDDPYSDYDYFDDFGDFPF